MSAFEQLKALVAGVPHGRYRLRNAVVIVTGAVLGLSADEIADLTVGEAEAQLAGVSGGEGKLARALLGKLVSAKGLEMGDLVLRSRKGGGRVNRITVWRIIVSACGAGLRYLQGIARALGGTGSITRPTPPQPVPVRVPVHRPRYRSLSDWTRDKGSG